MSRHCANGVSSTTSAGVHGIRHAREGRGATVASAMRVEHAAAFGVGVAAAAYALWRVSSSRASVVKRAWLGIVVARHPESSSSRERDRVAAEPDPPDGVPADYLCPIGGHVMLDPVLCGCSPSCGKSFDRRSIERWILEGSPSCPVTSRPLDLDKLYPNRTLRSAVETHLAENDVPADVMPPPSFEDSPEAESFRLVARAVAAGEPGPAPDAPTPGSTERRREGYGGEEDDDVPVAELRRRAYAAMEMRRALATEAKKRSGNDENNTPEQHRRASPSERLSRDALRRRTTRPPRRRRGWRRSWTSFARRTAAGENTPSGTPPPVPGPFAVPHLARERERRP